MIRRPMWLGLVVVVLLAACGTPPTTDSTPRAAATPSLPQATATPPAPASRSVLDSPPVVMSSSRAEPAVPSAVDARNAAEDAAIRAALERGASPSAAPPVGETSKQRAPNVPAQASAAAETLSERDLAAVRESLPALQQQMGQVIQRSFDAESFKRFLVNHPEFKKE